mmetsp:Transcript_3330/g.4441  ORF Transcript_3330/g.4441 Transcript_3330/m.4441 type:complete len:1330 (+) Transcript_3330:204-4193(+)
MVFEKTLTDIVKGIRASKRDTALYISACIAEIKSEINSTDPHTKANALQKLTFLQMMGYNMSYASFATIEVMSDPRFAHKRIGYLAASQAFTQDTDVILLTTNSLKKELRGAIGPGMNGVYEAGLAINCLSNIVTADLARDLLSEVTNLTVHPQPYLRKKAILCLLKMFMKYPQGLRLTFPKLQDSLIKDINPSVTSCAANVITELSDKNPKNYLVLAPSFFALLTNSSNNWMLIKVVKLLGSLVPVEPRLARKLLDPLANIVQNTQAKSLLYEAVYTITLCIPYCKKADGKMPANVPSIVNLSSQTLKTFLQESDQNLKYLGLVGFASLMVSHPKVLSGSEYRPLILACLSDEDVTIRTRALELLIGVATRKNVMELITQLLHHVDMATGSYKIDVVVKIIEICSSEKYALLSDFAWYMDVLVILARTRGIESNCTKQQSLKQKQQQQQQRREVGPLISSQIIDVALRVLPVRAYTVRRMISVLLQDGKEANQNSHHVSSGTFGMTTTFHMMPEVLPAAGWIVGEYASLIDEAVTMEVEDGDGDDEDELKQYDSSSMGTYHAIIQALTDPSNIDSTIATTQSIYIQAAMKVFAAATTARSCKDSELEASVSRLNIYLPIYMQSMDTEVQERAFTAHRLMESFGLISISSKSEHVPPLQLIKNDDESESSNDTRQNGASNSDDLLNLVVTSPDDMPKKTPSDSNVNHNSITGSTAAKSRHASETFKYLLIPEHMKPISAKAQRKKRQSAPANIQAALEADVNLSVFSKLLDGDRSRIGGKRSVESVCFTQQQPMRQASEDAPRKSLHALEGFGPESRATSNGSSRAVFNQGQSGASAEFTSGTALNQAKKHDPFYLNSNVNGKDDENGAVSSNRFGAIQLVDSDGGESDKHNGKKKRKKKDKRRKKDLSDMDLELFSGANNTFKPKSVNPTVLIDSDDDDDDEPIAAMYRGKLKAPSSMRAEDFDSLAQIDLTTPLRDDEVMPKHEHRVVPDRSVVEVAESTKKKKKNKKSKVSKKNKDVEVSSVEVSNEASNVRVNGAGGLDLLDFSGLSMNHGNESAKSNPINNAFDDLLALDIPNNNTSSQVNHPMDIDTTSGAAKPNNRKKAPKIWYEATIKVSKADGDIVDWNSLTLLYRTHLSKHGRNEVKLSYKINNNGASGLQGIKIQMEGSGVVEFESVDKHSSTAESSKIGPFSVNELRGTLTASGSSVPIKVILPVSYSLSSLPSSACQEDVANMLSTGNWASSTIKLNNSSELENDKIKAMFQHVLQAKEVENNGDESNSILISKASSGAIVLVLLKIGKKGIKADVKSTDKDLAKTIASSIKRIVL